LISKILQLTFTVYETPYSRLIQPEHPHFDLGLCEFLEIYENMSQNFISALLHCSSSYTKAKISSRMWIWYGYGIEEQGLINNQLSATRTANFSSYFFYFLTYSHSPRPV